MYPIKSLLKKNKRPQNSEQGVTLLMSILILSSVLAISLSLSAVILAEIKNSGDLARTEPALYGANAVTEEAMFKINRKVSDTQFPSYSTSVNTVSLSSQPRNLQDPIIQALIPSSKTIKFSLHDPNNLYGPGHYGKITVTYLPTGSTQGVKVYICQVDPLTPPTNPAYTCDNLNASNPLLIETGTVLSPSLLSKTWLIDPNKQQELILENSSTSANLYAKIETFAADLVTPMGMPYVAEEAVDITAGKSGVSRQVRVLVPSN